MHTGWGDAAVAPAVHPEHVSHNTFVNLTFFFSVCMTLHMKTEASVMRQRCGESKHAGFNPNNFSDSAPGVAT